MTAACAGFLISNVCCHEPGYSETPIKARALKLTFQARCSGGLLFAARLVKPADVEGSIRVLHLYLLQGCRFRHPAEATAESLGILGCRVSVHVDFLQVHIPCAYQVGRITKLDQDN